MTADTTREAAEEAAAKAAAAVLAAKPPAAKTERKWVECADGRRRSYAVLAGGNPGCPVACPDSRNHAKDAMCEYHHKNK